MTPLPVPEESAQPLVSWAERIPEFPELERVSVTDCARGLIRYMKNVKAFNEKQAIETRARKTALGKNLLSLGINLGSNPSILESEMSLAVWMYMNSQASRVEYLDQAFMKELVDACEEVVEVAILKGGEYFPGLEILVKSWDPTERVGLEDDQTQVTLGDVKTLVEAFQLYMQQLNTGEVEDAQSEFFAILGNLRQSMRELPYMVKVFIGIELALINAGFTYADYADLAAKRDTEGSLRGRDAAQFLQMDNIISQYLTCATEVNSQAQTLLRMLFLRNLQGGKRAQDLLNNPELKVFIAVQDLLCEVIGGEEIFPTQDFEIEERRPRAQGQPVRQRSGERRSESRTRGGTHYGGARRTGERKFSDPPQKEAQESPVEIEIVRAEKRMNEPETMRKIMTAFNQALPPGEAPRTEDQVRAAILTAIRQLITNPMLAARYNYDPKKNSAAELIIATYSKDL